MWLAYHMRVAVPAYSSVSCREKPTFSLASTNRRLAKVGALTSRSVPVMSLSERTIMDDLPSDQDRVDRGGEDAQALGELVGGGGQRRQELDDPALRAGRLHQPAPPDRLAAPVAGVLRRRPRESPGAG